MRAIIKFDDDFKKWVIDIETDDKNTIPVGKMIYEDIEMFEISKWDSKEEAVEWANKKGVPIKEDVGVKDNAEV